MEVVYLTADITVEELIEAKDSLADKSIILIYGQEETVDTDGLEELLKKNDIQYTGISKMQVSLCNSAEWTADQFEQAIEEAREKITGSFVDSYSQDNNYIISLFNITHRAIAEFGCPVIFDRKPIDVYNMQPEILQFLVPRTGQYEQCLEWLKQETKALASPSVISDQQLLSWPGVKVEHTVIENNVTQVETIGLAQKALKELGNQLNGIHE